MRVQSITRVIGVLAVGLWSTSVAVTQTSAPTDAAEGFEFRTNFSITQAEFEAAATEFRGPEAVTDGLGPTFNAAGCGECHATPALGGSAQITERRAGRFDAVTSTFFEHPGGSLIQDRAINVRAQETVQPNHNVIALRSSLSVLGDGFVEAIDSNDIADVRNSQPVSLRGTFIEVPVLESGTRRGGRFGWKNQHASLLSFAADAYLNEMGITSPLQPTENTINGRSAAAFDAVADPEDDGEDVELFADFMRATRVPPRDATLAATTDAQLGSSIFNSIGCDECHKRTFVTLPAGSTINGGTFRIPSALGNKIIHPFSDFLLHNVGTGDGIVQNGGAGTLNQLRTAPLWGLRSRTRFMHDLESDTLTEAIQRHGGQAASVRDAFNALSTTDKNRLLRFLASL